jgi:3' terminal RNA ribose 2'-O-methyltransferase Hen1
LVDKQIPLIVKLPILPCRGGEPILRNLFEPLGYEVTATPHLVDDRFPDWGDSRYFTVELKRTCTLREFLAHLYVLIPVLDNDKHYWIGDAEVEKLIRFGEGWLSTHPANELITRRYLKHQKSLTTIALERLTEEAEDDIVDREEDSLPNDPIVANVNLNETRLSWAKDKLTECNAKTVIDMGCGEGKLLQRLLKDPTFEKITGCDVSIRALEKARSRLRIDRLSSSQQARITLIQTALTYRDKRLAGYDAAALIEVVEHLDPSRLNMFERAVFGFAAPRTVIVSTPNSEYNALYPTLPGGQFRHDDHRFEWTRAEFQGWATQVAEEFGYQVEFEAIGPSDDVHGSPTQGAIFVRRAEDAR